LSLSSFIGKKLNKNIEDTSSNIAPVLNAAVSNPVTFKRRSLGQTHENTQIISGYFIQEKSYKEMVIARINTGLCGILALLVMVCLVSYYFVATGEIELNKIRKETLALNFDNEEMQNELDNLQSYQNVDQTVARTKILQRAQQVVELSAANLPSVNFDESKEEFNPRWFMGY